MIHYIFLFAFPALMAMMQPISKPWKRLWVWIPVGVIYALFIGLRDEVGADWPNYAFMYELESKGMTYSEAFAHGDPAFWLLMVWMHDLGMSVHGVNLVAGIIFMAGLIIFIRRMPNPWLGLTIVVSYTMLAVAMGYVRQGIALGLVLWAIMTLIDRKFIQFMILIALAAAFHKSAVLMVGLGLFQGGRNKYLKGLAALIMALGLYVAFMSGEEERLVKVYIEDEMQSSGAYIRILMNAIPAMFFLWFRKRWKRLYREDYVFWYLIALGSIVSLFLVPFASTAVDRVGLYFIPLQIVVFSRLPLLLRDKVSAQLTTSLIVAYYGLVYFVWLGFASWAFAWFPYQNLILDYFSEFLL